MLVLASCVSNRRRVLFDSSDLCVGDCVRTMQGNHSDYGEGEAFDAFDRVAGDHSWGVPDWRKYRRSY